MSIRLRIYYHSQENGAYLQQIVNSSGVGQLLEVKDLTHLPAPSADGADIVFLEYQENNPDLDHWIEITASNPHNPAVFLYFREISTNCLWKALRLGAKECFTYPIKEEEFKEAVGRVLARTAVEAALGKPTRIISFFGCKGGIGTSFLTANVACLLAQEHAGQVLVGDLDLRYGQLSYFFDVRPQHTISELIQDLERLDAAFLQGIFHRYDANLFLLAAPNRLEEAEAITPGGLEKILRYIKSSLGFRWILLDCCHQLDDLVLKALELSDELVLVTNQSVPALSNTRKILEVLKLMELGPMKLDILVNSWDKQGELTLGDVEDFLGMKVSGTVAWDYKQVESSINEGKPLVALAPRHPLCADLKKIATLIRGEEQLPGTNSTMFGWLKRLWSRK